MKHFNLYPRWIIIVFMLLFCSALGYVIKRDALAANLDNQKSLC